MVTLVSKMTSWLVVILSLVTAGSLNVTDQHTSESNQYDQVAILKQIRKMNNDGSYTFGYEAGDGSFKVETRDVLGNVKGTFGFVDVNGELKRVTYSSSNNTGFKSTTISPLQKRLSVIQSIPSKTDHNSTASIKKLNSMIFLTSTGIPSSTLMSAKPSVIQSVPARKSTTEAPEMASTTIKNIETVPKTIFGQYLKNSKNRSRQFMHEQRKQLQSSEKQNIHSIHPINEMKTVTLKNNDSTESSLDDALQPIRKFKDLISWSEAGSSNNDFRRQLDKKRNIKVQESNEDNNNDTFDIYNGRLLLTTRPLFTTTTSTTPSTFEPRNVGRSSTEPYKFNYESKSQVLQSNEEDQNLDKFYNFHYENMKSFDNDRFVEAPKTSGSFYLHNFPITKPSQRFSISQGRFSTTENFDANVMQQARVHHQQQLQKTHKEPPLGVILTNTPHSTFIENKENLPKIPIARQILMRINVPAKYIHHQPSEDKESNGYLTGNNPTELSLEPISNLAASATPAFIIRKKFNRIDDLHSERNTIPYINLKLIPQLYKHLQQQQFQHQQEHEYQPVHEKDYLRSYFHRNIVLPPESPNPIDPPLSRRDFQMLLRRLLINRYGIQSLDQLETYLHHTSDDDRLNTHHDLSSHYSLIFNDHSEETIPVAIPNKYDQRMMTSVADIPKKMAMISAPQGVGFSSNLLRGSKHLGRIKNNEYYNDMNINSQPVISFNDNAILPPPIRETLLLRMLQLAMDNKQQSISNNLPIFQSGINSYTPSSLVSKVITVPNYRKAGPVRSVQIITDEKSDENDDIKEKL